MISRSAVATMLLLVTAAVQPVCGQDTHVLIITGLGGDPEFRQKFSEWSGTLVSTVGEKFAIPAENIIFLSEDPAADPRIQGRSTRENVDGAFTTLASNSQPGDYIFVVLIGHGSYANGESRFNLPGPDLTAEELLEGFSRAHRQVFFHSASQQKDVEIVSFRLGLTQPVQHTPVRWEPPDGRGEVAETHRILIGARSMACALSTRWALAAGKALPGPAIFEDVTSTIFVPPGWQARADEHANLILTRTS